jgi:hypothetical protein
MGVFYPGTHAALIRGTYVHPNDTAEHDVFEVLNTTDIVQDFITRFDLSAITKNNFRLRLYVKIDGTNYRLHTTSTFGASEEEGQFEELAVTTSIKVTAQSAVAEGATRNLPYYYVSVKR